jgi:DNA-binding GntR family transcriptional regulator
VADPQQVIALPSVTLKAHLAERLRESIISGDYKPGARLNESKLARQFGVSRIPVREALMQLQMQGLVMNHPRRGMFVNTLSEEDTQKINSVRIVLESEAIKLCRARFTPEMSARLTAIVERMDAWSPASELDGAALDLEFHRTVWSYTGNAWLEKCLDSLVPAVLARQALDRISSELVRWRLKDHRTLLEVIQGNSRYSPEEAILVHLRLGNNNPERYSSLGCGKRKSSSPGTVSSMQCT